MHRDMHPELYEEDDDDEWVTDDDEGEDEGSTGHDSEG